MAATELAFTLEAVQTGADPSFSVNVLSGTDRMFIVAIGLPYSYTVINGVTLNGTSLTAVTDGTTTAQGNDTDFGHGVKFWRLLDASFPATGSRTLAIDTAGAGTEGYWIAHWQMANVAQTSNCVDVAVTSHTSTDPLSTSGLAATANDQECFAIGCSTNPATGLTLTIDGTGITQVTVDNAPPSSFPHYWKAGHKTVASGARTVTVDATGSQGSNLIVAFIVGSTATAVDVSASTLTLPAITLSGSASPVVAVNSSTLTLGALTLSGSASPVVAVSDSTLTLGALQLSGTATPVGPSVDASTLTLPALTLTGSASPVVAVSASALTLPALTLSGTASPVVDVSSATLTLPALTLSGSAASIVSVATATLTLPALRISGEAFGARTIAPGHVEGSASVGSPHARATARGAQATATVSRARGRLV